MGLAEFDLIERIRARLHPRDDVVLGIGDDAALLRVPPGRELVVTADTLNDGVHFPRDTAPGDIGWKSLAVNLSDLAAMGAQPAWCTLSLSLPRSDAAWLDAFIDGFLALATQRGVALVGGDTTRGPLSISVTAMGLVEPGRALRRDAARVGDDVWVTGTLGDAAAALALLGDASATVPDEAFSALRRRLDRPEPRNAAGVALAGIAHACIDVSDGLLADLGHVCARSGVGADIELAALPVSAALQMLGAGESSWQWQASGGDDYELCFTAPAQARDTIPAALEAAGTPATRIGRIVAGESLRAFDAHGQPWQAFRRGYDHFA